MAVSAGGGSYSTAAGRAANARSVARMNTGATTKKFAAPAKMTPLKKKVVTKAPARAAAITRRAAPVKSSRSGSYQSVAPAAAAPEPGVIEDQPMSDEEYLGGDETFQGQLAGFQKTLTDFLADKTRRTGDIQRDYDTAKGLWTTNRAKGREDMLNDFAARGLARSGLYDTATTDFEKQMQDQLTGLETNRTTGLTDLSTEETNLSREQELAKAQARQDALNRRAQALAAGL